MKSERHNEQMRGEKGKKKGLLCPFGGDNESPAH